MLKKNISVARNEVDAAENLDDDQEIVISDTRTIKKRRSKAEPEQAEAEETDFIDVDEDGEPVEDDEDFAPGSIGELLTQNRNQQLRHTQCNILVNRKADSPGETFARPSRGGKHPAIRNIDLTQNRNDIEELVQNTYFGGHYYLQIQIGNTMHSGWSCDLADPLDVWQRIRATDPQPEAGPPIAAPIAAGAANPFAQRIEELKLEREYDELKFGAERRRLERMEAELEELRTAAIKAAATSKEPQSETLLILEKALTAGPALQERLLEAAFPQNDEKERGFLERMAGSLMSHPGVVQAVSGAVGNLVTRFLGGGTPPAAAPPRTVADMMREQPPGHLLTTQPPPRFGRRPEPSDPSNALKIVEGPETETPKPPELEIDVEGFLAAMPDAIDPAAADLAKTGPDVAEQVAEILESGDAEEQSASWAAIAPDIDATATPETLAGDEACTPEEGSDYRELHGQPPPHVVHFKDGPALVPSNRGKRRPHGEDGTCETGDCGPLPGQKEKTAC